MSYGFKDSILKFSRYNEVSKFRIELSLTLKLYEIYKKYGLKLTYKPKHGELYHNNTLIYRAGCVTHLAQVITNSYDMYNEAHNRLFSRIEELSPNIIKVRA